MLGCQGGKTGKDVVDEVRDGCGCCEVGDGNVGLGVSSTVACGSSLAVHDESASSGVQRVSLEETLRSEEEAGCSLSAECFE